MSALDSASSVYLARQPIYDRRLKVFAYELLYRQAGGTSAGNVGPQQSASTLIRTLVEIGLDKLVGDKPAFINIPHYFLGDPSLYLLPPDRVILEILEDTEPTTANLDSAKDLADRGYRLAIDDFVFGSPMIEFVPFAKFVKLDVIQNTPRMLTACVEMLKKSRVRLLAEKVETMEMFAVCTAKGCNYFQGYFCSKPEVISGRKAPPSLVNLVQLLSLLQDPSVTLDQLEEVIVCDVGLTYRLLRMVNSVMVSADEYADSIKAALMVLGFERVRSLVSLLALAGIEGKPSELLITAMIRAKMCEKTAPVLGFNDPAKHFTVGLLSVLDAMFDMPMEEILEQIPLSSEMKTALGNPDSESALSQTLRIALAFEAGEWENFDEIHVHGKKINSCYVEAVQWADFAEQSYIAA